MGPIQGCLQNQGGGVYRSEVGGSTVIAAVIAFRALLPIASYHGIFTAMSAENVRRLIVLLDSAANGLPTEDPSLLLRVLESEPDRLVGDACHEFRHFITDEDLRRKDREYDLLMRRKLKDYAGLLREKSESGQ
jgi:hypothetical protein